MSNPIQKIASLEARLSEIEAHISGYKKHASEDVSKDLEDLQKMIKNANALIATLKQIEPKLQAFVKEAYEKMEHIVQHADKIYGKYGEEEGDKAIDAVQARDHKVVLNKELAFLGAVFASKEIGKMPESNYREIDGILYDYSNMGLLFNAIDILECIDWCCTKMVNKCLEHTSK